MSSTFYLPRRLFGSENEVYTEEKLLNKSSYIVVLAEPGGGKTTVLNSLAKQLGTNAVTAKVFQSMGVDETDCPIVIDAFDELAKIDETGIDKVLACAKKANPTWLIISSRSSEWDDAATHSFEQYFGKQPLLARLYEFDEEEQRKIFEHHASGEDFVTFQNEVARFDLAVLLPNPQFLKLFADAYIESGRGFADKRSIFTKAIERLAKEVNTTLTRPIAPLATDKKIALASEIFAKLLLSGAEGICTSEASENRIYPWLVSLVDGAGNYAILATRLFKLGNTPNLHLPVHKIVAEYCAADYLCKRIADTNNPLKLYQCLAIIAPNSTVRDELRGLLGWMAALGDQAIQEAAINLDPYAILANGDPSQLAPSSKRLLIRQLKQVEAQDPYFRRGDFWRRFSVAVFFTQDVVDEIKSLLTTVSEGNLRDLMLELLAEAPVIGHLTKELRQILYAPQEGHTTRLLANRRLLEAASHDHGADLKFLIQEGSKNSLELAGEIICAFKTEAFVHNSLIDFFLASAKLYPGYHAPPERTIVSRYFIKQCIASLALATIEWLLDELTKDLACQCGKKTYECDCRNGISKIVGTVLDRYFTLAAPPFDPVRVWQWVGNLNFHEKRSPNQSKAVQVMQENDDLRQGILVHVFGSITDQQEIFEAKIYRFDQPAHAGLYLQSDDVRFIVDLAFQRDNPSLWTSFIATHKYYRNGHGPNALRNHMRKQALAKPLFMREWVKVNRGLAQFQRKDRVMRLNSTRSARRYRKRENDIRIHNIQYFLEHRDLVESGQDWSALTYFAQLVLMSPEKITQETGNETMVRTALRNCLSFIAPDVPDLCNLAEIHSASQNLLIEDVLYAACIENFRFKGNLEGVDAKLLKALRTNFDVSYDAVSNDERTALKHEVDRLILSDDKSAEDFLRRYLEPQLARRECLHPKIGMLQNDEIFSQTRPTLSIEWLRRFPELASYPLNTLFDIATRYGERDELNQIIAERCAQMTADHSNSSVNNEELEQKRKFWLARAWYFLPETPEIYWDWLKADKDNIFLFEAFSGLHNRADYPYWPRLSASKVEAILTAFIGHWPKVDLPNSYGTGSPREETAYRFLTELIWLLESDESDHAIPVLERLLVDARFTAMHLSMKSIRFAQIRKKSLQYFEPPTPSQIVELLDHDVVVTVEGLRQRVIEELQAYQNEINGGEFNCANRFYAKDERLDEEACTEIIAERLSLRLQPQNIAVTPEHQLKAEKRSDFTVAKLINGKRRLLVTEVKGQWHRELYTAAAAQLYERYAIHPDAEQQGIYLVIWFGRSEDVAGRRGHCIANAQELKSQIEEKIPPELRPRIDVFVLDVAKC